MLVARGALQEWMLDGRPKMKTIKGESLFYYPIPATIGTYFDIGITILSLPSGISPCFFCDAVWTTSNRRDSPLS